MRKPVSSRKTRCAFSREAFFNAGPFLVDPALDFSLVALHRSALRFLGAPFQSVATNARLRRPGNERQSATESVRRCGDRSTGPSESRPPEPPSASPASAPQLLQG